MAGDALRLAFCDKPPYAVYDVERQEYRGAWLTVVSDLAAARGMAVEYMRLDAGECEGGVREVLVRALVRGVADVALYPFIFGMTYGEGEGGLLTPYPIDNGSPIFVSKRGHAAVAPFTDPFSKDAWVVLLALGCATLFVAVVADRHGSRLRHVPHVILAACGSVDLPQDATPPVYLLYCWLAVVSLLLTAIYTSVMAQVLVVNTNEVDTFALAVAQGATVGVTADIETQLALSKSAYALVLDNNYVRVEEAGALAHLPVLVSWPVASMMKQLSCNDIDLAYRELSKVSYSVLVRDDAPAWLFGDIRTAVFDRRFPDAVQNFVLDRPFCADASPFVTPGLELVLPVVYVAAGFVSLAWAVYLADGWYKRRVVPLRDSLLASSSRRLAKTLSSFKRH
jgi:hypothetical protein